MKKYVLSMVVCLGIISTSFKPAEVPFSAGPLKTIIIDAGHGGKDPGTSGAKYREKDLSLKVALELKRILNENLPTLNVVMTRSSDKFIELHQRARQAQNYNADFFISIHCNSSPRSHVNGTISYVLGINKGQENYETVIAENEVILFEENYEKMYGGFDPHSPEGAIFMSVLRTVNRTESSKLAAGIEHQFASRVGRKSLGVRQAPFIVLWQSGVPSILVEVGFLSNAREEIFLGDETGQIFMASAIYRAIKQYNLQMATNRY